MKIVISEKQFGHIIQKQMDEDYPTSWNIEYFKSLKTFKDRINYCQEHLKRISSGTSRIVYMIDEQKVLKLAKNNKGILQNEIEIEHSGYYDLEDIVAKVFEYHDKGLWVEMELARKLTPKKFMEIMGFAFDDYAITLRIVDDEYKGKKSYLSKPKDYEAIIDHSFVNDVTSYMHGYDSPVGDLARMTSYGVVNRNGKDVVVLIDYGLTWDIYNTYYRR